MLTVLLRQMTRHKLYTAINLLGLGLGIAVFLTMALITRYEYGYDSYIPAGDRIYRIDSIFEPPGEAPKESSQTSFASFAFLRQDFPAIKAAARVLTAPTPVRWGEHIENETVSQTDSDFFAIFHLRMLEGNPREALDGPGKAVLPASLARKFFGTPHALGKSFFINSNHEPVIVSAVYEDPPSNASNVFGILIPFSSHTLSLPPFANLGSNWGTVWIRVDDPHAMPGIIAGLHQFPVHHPANFSSQQVAALFGHGGMVPIPLRAIHFRDAAIGEGGNSRQLVDILLLVGIAALATAVVNYVNLATAQAGLRAREVAIRKTLGATRVTLFAHFMAEAIILTALATLIGCSFCEIALRWVDTLGGWHVMLTPGFVIPVAASVTLVAGSLAGIYPSLVLSSYSAATVLAAGGMPAGGRLDSTLRNTLVVLQFGFAIALTISTIVMTRQAAFVHQLDRGLNQSGLIVIDSLADPTLFNRQEELVRRFASIPGITIATRSDIYPHHVEDSDYFLLLDGTHETSLRWGFATPGYLDAIGAIRLAGRLFDEQHGTDYARDDKTGDGTSAENPVIISRATANAFGFVDPQAAVGQTIREANDPKPHRVIGVIEDIRWGDAHAPVPRLLLFGTRRSFSYVAAMIRFDGVSEDAALTRLRAAWLTMAPDVPFSAQSVPEMFADDYRTDRNHGTLFGIGSAVAIGIACLGLYGLSAFTVTRQLREIGIRKVLGATGRDIIVLLGGRFLRPVLIANLIAWPVAWILMRTWLSGFDRRITLDAWPFIQVASAALLIAGATVLRQSLRAARRPPAQALQQE